MRKSKWFIPVLALAVVILLVVALWTAAGWRTSKESGPPVTTTKSFGY